MKIIYLVLLLIHITQEFVECNSNQWCVPPSSKRESKKSCPELKDTDECSFNHYFLKRKAIRKIRKAIEECNSAEPISCDDVRESRYRTIDGSCNNLEHPHWGKSNNCLQRFLPFEYGDGKSSPRLSCSGDELPNARTVSNVIHRQFKAKRDKHTLFFMTWGQALSHDLSNNDVFRSKESGGQFSLQCCDPDPIISDKCVSYEVPEDDPFFLKYNMTCISTARTVPCQLCNSDVRYHSNQNSNYHDMSIVYGQTEKQAKSLRSKVDGQLKVQDDPDTGPLLPPIFREQLCTALNASLMCFTSGDPRTQQNLLLLALHTLMVRHHNNICLELKKLNPHWTDETLYQKARSILIAQAQKITYKSYIREILGEHIVEKDQLGVLPGVQYTEYNPCLEATTWDEFTTAAQRYGHVLIPNEILEIDPETNEKEIVPTKDIYYYPFGFYYGEYDHVALGMSKKCHDQHSIHLSNGARNFLYRNRTADAPAGKDLAAISVLRGREHGIPSYVYYLKYCHCYTARSFKDLLKFIPCNKLILFQKVYRSIYDIDLYSGGLAEYHVKGGMIGPTFACLVRKQHYITKFGDRFYFEHGNQKGSFTPDQLREIKKVNLARIICENVNITHIQKNVFLPPCEKNPIVPCNSLRKFNYEVFQETK